MGRKVRGTNSPGTNRPGTNSPQTYCPEITVLEPNKLHSMQAVFFVQTGHANATCKE